MLRRLWTLRDLEARLCDLEERPVYRDWEGPGAVISQDGENLEKRKYLMTVSDLSSGNECFFLHPAVLT